MARIIAGIAMTFWLFTNVTSGMCYTLYAGTSQDYATSPATYLANQDDGLYYGTNEHYAWNASVDLNGYRMMVSVDNAQNISSGIYERWAIRGLTNNLRVPILIRLVCEGYFTNPMPYAESSIYGFINTQDRSGLRVYSETVYGGRESWSTSNAESGYSIERGNNGFTRFEIWHTQYVTQFYSWFEIFSGIEASRFANFGSTATLYASAPDGLEIRTESGFAVPKAESTLPTPEPSSMCLFMVGLLVVLITHRRLASAG